MLTRGSDLEITPTHLVRVHFVCTYVFSVACYCLSLSVPSDSHWQPLYLVDGICCVCSLSTSHLVLPAQTKKTVL